MEEIKKKKKHSGKSTLLFTPLWRIISPSELNLVITARYVYEKGMHIIYQTPCFKRDISRWSRKSGQCKIIVMNQILHDLIMSVTLRFIYNSSNPSKPFNARKHIHRRMCFTSEWATARLTVKAFRVNYAALTVFTECLFTPHSFTT